MSESWRKHEGGIEITTDPQGDAKRAEEKNVEGEPKGVKFVGGAQHDKMDKGVKRVSRRS